MPTDMKGRGGIAGLAFLVLWLILGVTWTLFGNIYDLRWPGARLLVSTSTVLASYMMMDVGLRLAGVSGKDRKSASTYSILPWNGVYLYQLAYLGFLFIPLETGVCTVVLKRRTSLSWTKAVLVACVVRGLSFGFTVWGTDLLRWIWMR